MKKLNYKLYLSIIFTTGFCSLGYQVIWQRYLSVLVGSHARSSTIIISVFLLGLALGYYVFGRLSEKVKDRYILLKIYGFIELATGFYAVIFPYFFKFFLYSPISHTNNFWVHLLLAGILLIPATFLMGATVPIMTTVLPENKENINLIHSRIYGLNTLGAFLGTLFAGLYIIPHLGYDMSLILLGALNILVSLFYIKNGLSGPSYEKQKPEVISHNFNQRLLYVLGFIAGLTCLALEVLWFRILGLTMGNSFVIFPFVLSIFVLMIGLGSLTLKKLSVRTFQNALACALLFSFITFLTVPYLPLFVSHIRVSFANHHLASYLYHIFVYCILLCVLSPAIFYLGRLLPFMYSMIQKNNKDYGLKVGYLYFLNTLGTFLGAIALGYLAFHIFALKTIYLLSLSLLLICGLYFLKSRWVLKGLILILSLTTILTPFSRKHHEVGLFRKRTPTDTHFKNIISQVNTDWPQRDILYLKDGPNATVSIHGHKDKKDKIVSKSIVVNGKSDGNTTGDYGTVTLLSLIPYLITQGNHLKTMVIGIGTGVTAGVLSTSQRVSQVDVVEISGAVIDSVKFMAPENMNFHKSPKTTIYKNDAFQFLKSVPVEKKYNIIISEPPNPWVVGVENLYTPYFYELAKSRLTKDGILAQWIHTYSMSEKILTTILSNLKGTFKNLTISQTANGDIAFFASNRSESFAIDARNIRVSPKSQNPVPINSQSDSGNTTEQLTIEPEVRTILNNISVERVSDLNFYTIYNSREVDAIIETHPLFSHEIFYPRLNKESYSSFYSGEKVIIQQLLSPMYRRIIQGPNPHLDKQRLEEIVSTSTARCKEKTVYIHFPCTFLITTYASALKDIKSPKVKKRILAYSTLRNRSLIEKDISFFKKAISNLPPIEKKESFLKTSKIFINELSKEQEYKLAKVFLQKLESKGFLDKKETRRLAEKS